MIRNTLYPPLVIGNWKMNGLQESSNRLLMSLLKYNNTSACDVVLCPPATLLCSVANIIKEKGSRFALGGQDCHSQAHGAYTGDISAFMLKDLYCRYVLVGHSERRCYYQENNALIRKKAESALDAGLIPVICVGESEAERQSGDFLSVIATQLKESLPDNATPDNTIIAYEPVWAIGSGRIPSCAEIEEVHTHILNSQPHPFRVLYGGSVKPDNTRAIIAIPSVSGLLVGGCSLNADDFLHIIELVGS